MDLTASIAQMSTSMSAAKLQMNINTSMTKKAMDTTAQMANGIIKMMDSVPKFAGEKGSILDVRA